MYNDDRAYGDRFLPEVTSIIRRHVTAIPMIIVAPEEADQKECSDLMVLHGSDRRVAVRIRRPGFADRFPDQFTLRFSRDNGVETEMSKIADGWGDLLFYGHASADEMSIGPWWLIDLKAFRAVLIRQQPIERGTVNNGDGTWFAWFKISSFPLFPRLVVACR